jgi:hypothetical protein
MVGFIEGWQVSGVTSSEAKLAKPIIELGYYLSNRIELWSLKASDIEEIMDVGEKIVKMKQSFDEFYYQGDKGQRDNSARFLTWIAALDLGKQHTFTQPSWQEVRSYAQGLYAAMVDDREKFDMLNIPFIEKILSEIHDAREETTQ